MFVSRIKEIRTTRGMTQKQLSILAGISQVQISNIERNSKSTTLNTLENIAKSLNCCVYDLFHYRCHMYNDCSRLGKNSLNCFNQVK
jgi:transcriptional regulator with XRE-family HTH domain